MRHYIPWPTDSGYVVAYMNHQGELVAVMECTTLERAYMEAHTMTRRSYMMEAQAMTVPTGGNRYLRGVQ